MAAVLRALSRGSLAVLAAAMSIVCGLVGPADAQVLARLPALGVQRDAVTVSGLSSGGYMAEQFAVAYSGAVTGVAVIAGGPYGCSRGAVSTAMLACSCPADPPFALTLAGFFGLGCQVFSPGVYQVFAESATLRNRTDIDDPAGLARQRVWLFSGGQDRVVDSGLVDAVETFRRQSGVPAAQLRRRHLAAAAHGLPTQQPAVPCSTTGTPFLTDCGVDAAGELLQWLYPALQAQGPGSVVAGSLKRFSQDAYRGRVPFNGLDRSGWLYVPAACEPPGAGCALHVALHGCEQGQGFVAGGRRFGLQFVNGAGYNRWAEAGRIVVLYPQVLPSTRGSLVQPYRFNPKGCWDFWGYTEKYAADGSVAPRFDTRSAPQMKALKAMVDDLRRQP